MSIFTKRFSKPWYTVWYFVNKKDIDVRCPRCNGHAVVWGESKYRCCRKAKLVCRECSYSKVGNGQQWYGPVKVSGRRPCGNCGFKWVFLNICKNKMPEPIPAAIKVFCQNCNHENDVEVDWRPEFFNKDPVDPYFGYQLWFLADFKDEIVWLYNIEHLQYLKEYISANLRERDEYGGMRSLVARLPKWMKLAKNKKSILKILNKLEKM